MPSAKVNPEARRIPGTRNQPGTTGHAHARDAENVYASVASETLRGVENVYASVASETLLWRTAPLPSLPASGLTLLDALIERDEILI